MRSGIDGVDPVDGCVVVVGGNAGIANGYRGALADVEVVVVAGAVHRSA